jgi:VWFA-related protein
VRCLAQTNTGNGDGCQMNLGAICSKIANLCLHVAMCLALTGPFAFSQSLPANNAQTGASGQAKESPPKDSVGANDVEAKMVTLPVTVRDKHGQIVKELTKDDFTLEEDGRSQTIRSFSRETNLPMMLGLLVDTSYSQKETLDEERNASKNFFDQMLAQQEKDKMFLLHFDREVELLQDLTHSREKLQSALELLKTADPDRERSDDPNGSDSSSGGRHQHGSNQLYDAIYLASNEVLKQTQGRKAMIILSDGVDRGSKKTLESAIEAAQRSDTIVYAIYFKGREENGGHGSGMGRGGGYPGGGGGWPGGGGGYPGGGRRGGGQRAPEEPRVDGKKVLEQIAKETGGRYFEVTKKQLVGDIYASIVDELRLQYSLGFTPDKDAAGEGYHRVSLQVKKKDMTVQTRAGFFAGGTN